MQIPVTIRTIGPEDFKPVYRREYIIGCDIEKQTLTYSYKDGEMWSSFENCNLPKTDSFTNKHLLSNQISLSL